ncbi:hypothetical protein J3D56_000605 [Erwinia persicina]|jgi:hypothetical protein|uniref:Uncharacterized protein n=2 Tax=Erwinia TaxID=551 RepID=A0ABV4EA04_9GAMM|nr:MULTISPECIES: hypothetical protein [Erwinia]MCP1437169.1 hypothetical protein [Erwinia persicina]MDN4627270.1 hypothetical protein [Erwinia sp. PsM31]MDN8540534.1 hypothetical protein [Erwinia sp. BC051422]
MNLTMSAWLQHKIDEYKFSIRDITVDYTMAQAKVNRPECTLEQLRKFNDTCLDMAELCQLNGDDQSYLHALGRLHQRLLQELGNPERERLFRMQAWQLARHSLTRLCHQLALSGEWDKATALQNEFVRKASRIM